MQWQALQVTEVAEPGAKIVECDADAAIGQRLELLHASIELGDERLLGNLQRQPLGGEPGLGCCGEDRLGETLAGQVGRGDVERQPQRFRPGRGHGQRPAGDVPGQLGGMTTAFGDVEQGFRADAA